MTLAVSVLGCGWLGFPLASRLVLKGYAVKGSTTQADKKAVLSNQGIAPYVLTFNPDLHDNPGDFFSCDVLIITVPFRRLLADPHFYHQQISSILNQLTHAQQNPKIIFTSSTAVYPNNGETWTEEDHVITDNARSTVLLAIEKDILARGGTVVRLGGLYGPEREIHRFFLKAGLLKSAQGRMNLIHRDDAIAIMEAVMEKKAWGEVLNAVSDKHPSREELYTHLAAKYRVQQPSFDGPARLSASKIVLNDKIKRMLEYRFIHPDPMDA